MKNSKHEHRIVATPRDMAAKEGTVIDQRGVTTLTVVTEEVVATAMIAVATEMAIIILPHQQAVL